MTAPCVEGHAWLRVHLGQGVACASFSCSAAGPNYGMFPNPGKWAKPIPEAHASTPRPLSLPRPQPTVHRPPEPEPEPEQKQSKTQSQSQNSKPVPVPGPDQSVIQPVSLSVSERASERASLKKAFFQNHQAPVSSSYPHPAALLYISVRIIHRPHLIGPLPHC